MDWKIPDASDQASAPGPVSPPRVTACSVLPIDSSMRGSIAARAACRLAPAATRSASAFRRSGRRTSRSAGQAGRERRQLEIGQRAALDPHFLRRHAEQHGQRVERLLAVLDDGRYRSLQRGDEVPLALQLQLRDGAGAALNFEKLQELARVGELLPRRVEAVGERQDLEVRRRRVRDDRDARRFPRVAARRQRRARRIADGAIPAPHVQLVVGRQRTRNELPALPPSAPARPAFAERSTVGADADCATRRLPRAWAMR